MTIFISLIFFNVGSQIAGLSKRRAIKMTSTPVDIYSMLNKAQQQYNSSNNNNNNQLDSVSAFFASVKSPGSGVMSDNKMSEVPVQQHGGVPRFHIQNRPMQVQQQTPVNFVNIEQIEKQHGVTNSGE